MGEEGVEFGVAGDEGGDVGAGGDDAEVAFTGVGEGGADELFGEAAAAEFRGDERVREDHAIAFEDVVGVREVSVDFGDPALGGFVVADGDGGVREHDAERVFGENGEARE